MGMNFRSLAVELSQKAPTSLSDRELDAWVEQENAVVMKHLGRTLRPDERVLSTVRHLSGSYRMAVVSSSKLDRLAVCFTSTGLDRFFRPDLRFSAQDSLPQPTSKPDPAVYQHAVQEMGIAPERAIAVEDAVAGVRSAVDAGIHTIGNVVFVPPNERRARREDLIDAGACVVIEEWSDLDDLLLAFRQPR